MSGWKSGPRNSGFCLVFNGCFAFTDRRRFRRAEPLHRTVDWRGHRCRRCGQTQWLAPAQASAQAPALSSAPDLALESALSLALDLALESALSLTQAPARGSLLASPRAPLRPSVWRVALASASPRGPDRLRP